MGVFFQTVWENAVKLVSSMKWNDFLDIFIVAMVLYYCFKLCRQTRAFHLVKGLSLLAIVYLVISALNLSTSSYLFSSFFGDIVIILVLLFQTEIRHAIETFGRGDFKKFTLFSSKGDGITEEQLHASASHIAKAVSNMSDSKTGALIVVEGKTPLGEIIATGSPVDAAISIPVIENIFYPKAPLHDGAMIIRDNRINAAGCILPLTQNDISRDLGTRHRAALGMSEHSDSFVIVVSEETGAISVAQNSVLKRNLSNTQLLDKLTAYLMRDYTDTRSLAGKTKRRKNKDEE